jgi:8-oxo-dGTP diphosphatase
MLMAEQRNEQHRPLVGVSVLIKNGDRILLEERDKDPGNGAWKAPGGHMEFGETPEETAIREVEEEVGIKMRDLKFRTLTNDVFEDGSKHYITIWMEANYESESQRLKLLMKSQKLNGLHGIHCRSLSTCPLDIYSKARLIHHNRPNQS